MVIRELTESDLLPPTRSAGNRDRFPILNVGECDVHSDGQEGLLVQKLCNISGGGHFKEKQASPASQKIMVDDEGGDFQASFPDIFADYQNPPLTGDINMGNKAWDNWQHAPMTWWHCQLNFAVWCATAGCGVSADDHLQAKDPLLASLYRFHVYYAIRRLLVELKVALPGDQSHSWYQNAYDARAYKRLCTEFGVSLIQIRGKSWTTGAKASDLGARIWSRQAPTGMRTTPMAPSSNRRTPYAITGTYHGRGRCSFSINQKASRKQVWSASMTVYGRMCGLSWERKPRRARTFSRAGRGSTLKSSSWPTLKTPSPRPSTSPAASLAIRRRSSMH